MHRNLSRIAAFVCSTLATVQALACQTWIKSPINGHEYTITAPLSWSAAKKEAARLGGHLATIRSAAENAWVYKTFRASLPRNTYVYIGFTDEVKEGTWVWDNGEAVTYTNWAKGRPDNASGNQNYGVMWDEGEWDDTQPHPYRAIIERRAGGVRASFSTYGVGCASTAAIPTITGTPPKLGGIFTLEIKGFLPQPRFGQVLFGTSGKRWGIIPLPLSLAVLGMGNCNLLVSPDVSSLIATDAKGNFKTTIKVPMSSFLVGTEVYGQAWAPDPGSNRSGVATTNAFKAVLRHGITG